MKKRILAMLLTGTLVVSGLPIIVGADESAVTETADPLSAASWSDNVTEVNDVFGDGDSYQYLRFYNIDYCGDGVIYEDNNVTMKKGQEYRLSFWYRCAPTANWPNTDSESGEGIREFMIIDGAYKNILSTYPSQGILLAESGL